MGMCTASTKASSISASPVLAQKQVNHARTDSLLACARHGTEPTQQLRSKTKIEDDFSGNVEDAKLWSFDGSSTQQSSGGKSDLLLKPVYCYCKLAARKPLKKLQWCVCGPPRP